MIQTIKRLIHWSGERRKRLYIGFVYSFIHTLFIAMSIMGAAYAMNLIMDNMRGVRELTPDWVLIMLGWMTVSVLGRFLFAYLRAKAQESIGFEVTAQQRVRIGDMLKRVSLGFFVKNNAGEIASAVSTDLSFIEMFGMKMIDVVVNGYISAFTLVLCLSFYSIPVALAALAGIILSSLFLRLLGQKSRQNAPIHQKAQDDMVAATIEYVRGMPVVKAFKQEGVSREGICRAYQASRDINIKIEKKYVPINCLHLFSLKAASVAIILVAALLGIGGVMDIPMVVMMAIFSFVIFSHVEQINNAEHVMRVIEASMDKLERIESAQFIDADGDDIALSSYGIRFNNVSFAYEKRKVLDDVSFTIAQNTTTAIVGPSGSGKTTICSLLTRFYDANQGSIEIGGVDIRNMTCDSLLKNFSMVFQKVYLFHDTILSNIRFGRPDATMEEVIDAAKKACCHDFITALPNGYETVIGEGGSTLSGGEKQRISIARAMLKDAPIVILDEATASVDPENEQSIQQAIGALVHGKTLVIIAHRLATIRHANQILVVEQGRIVQRGTHEQLAEEDGVYRRFLSIREAAEGWSLS